ncbi:MAG: hypothetical protein U1E27_12145, partial [Kiritimatiellia bacterium]|nr:hypothetical protein [Kiritimatiellia bacterium]
QLQLDIADAWLGIGDRDRARESLVQVTQELLPRTGNPHLIAPVLARCAIRWGRLGDAQQVLELEQHTEPMIQGLQGIEQPEQWALWAEAWQAAGDRAAAVERIERAVRIAQNLKNPRPRALAGVDICLSLARAGIEEPGLVSALETLQKTFAE